MNEIRDQGAPEAEPVSAGGLPPESADAGSLEAQEDFVHESVELPDWVPIAFGLILVIIAAAAIWMA